MRQRVFWKTTSCGPCFINAKWSLRDGSLYVRCFATWYVRWSANEGVSWHSGGTLDLRNRSTKKRWSLPRVLGVNWQVVWSCHSFSRIGILRAGSLRELRGRRGCQLISESRRNVEGSWRNRSFFLYIRFEKCRGVEKTTLQTVCYL